MEASRRNERKPKKMSKYNADGKKGHPKSENSEERRLRRKLRKAQRIAKHFEELGLDENGNELDAFSIEKYPVREWTFTVPGMSDKVALNPVVTLIAVAFLWGLVLWVICKCSMCSFQVTA